LLRTVVAVESSANKNVGTNKSGYTGLFQMGKDAVSEVKMSGLAVTMKEVTEDWRSNVAAGVAYLKISERALVNNKLDTSALNIYILHQQGQSANGGLGILKAVNAQDSAFLNRPANRNELNNFPDSLKANFNRWGKPITVQDYYDYWNDYFKTMS